jgi:hypothetical protein
MKRRERCCLIFSKTFVCTGVFVADTDLYVELADRDDDGKDVFMLGGEETRGGEGTGYAGETGVTGGWRWG